MCHIVPHERIPTVAVAPWQCIDVRPAILVATMKLIEIVEADAGDRLLGAACTLDAAEMPARLREWAALRDRSTGIRPIPGGVVIGLSDAEPIDQVANLASLESECCAFYTFLLRVEGRTRELEITAGEGREIAVRTLLGIS
jgi:hypothetical protein